MKLLVIGGGQFFGAALVDAALAAGDEVTAVQRGVTSRPAPEGLEVLTGDRATDLAALLRDREFDAVVDTCGYMPDVVRTSAELLRDRVGRYCFISTISTYAQGTGNVFTEEGSPLDERVPETEEFVATDYGVRKVQCERVVTEVFGDRSVVVRPGLIVGPHDHTERFAYWPRRLAEGGTVLMGSGPDYTFQVIDARDLAAFVRQVVVDGRSGPVNAVGPHATFTDLLDACPTAASTRVVYADDGWLLEREVVPFMELPLWLPDGTNLLASRQRAESFGLRSRPLAETAADTLAWDRDRGTPPMPTALSRAREAALVAELATAV